MIRFASYFLGTCALSALIHSWVEPWSHDPADDLSLTLQRQTDPGLYRLISEERVKRILADRLDLFPQSKVPELARHLLGLCSKYRFDPTFILALIEVESQFKIKAVSPVGAIGLMQLMPSTAVGAAKELGVSVTLTSKALMDPFLNVQLGIHYLAYLRDRYHGLSPYFLVAAYNAGPGRVDSFKKRADFKPIITKRYYEAIRHGVPTLISYPGYSL